MRTITRQVYADLDLPDFDAGIDLDELDELFAADDARTVLDHLPAPKLGEDDEEAYDARPLYLDWLD